MASARSRVSSDTLFMVPTGSNRNPPAERIRAMVSASAAPPNLRAAVVLRVAETWCQVRIGEVLTRARFAPQFPSPRTERVSPGHLVAIARAADQGEVVL